MLPGMAEPEPSTKEKRKDGRLQEAVRRERERGTGGEYPQDHTPIEYCQGGKFLLSVEDLENGVLDCTLEQESLVKQQLQPQVTGYLETGKRQTTSSSIFSGRDVPGMWSSNQQRGREEGEVRRGALKKVSKFSATRDDDTP